MQTFVRTWALGLLFIVGGTPLVACDGGASSGDVGNDAESTSDVADTVADTGSAGDGGSQPGDTSGDTTTASDTAPGDGDAGQATESWTRLLGSAQEDQIYDVATGGSGNVYVVGTTEGDLAGETNGGKFDAFVASYGPEGSRNWVELLGASRGAVAQAVAVDGAGHLYVAGQTNAAIGEATPNGKKDGFVTQYDTEGTRNWSEMIGSPTDDATWDVAVDGSGDLYVVGEVAGALGEETHEGNADAYVANYDAEGDRQWVEMFGTSVGDAAHGVTVDAAGNVYVVGAKDEGSEGVPDIGDDNIGGKAFVAKYDGAGQRQWMSEDLADGSVTRALGVAVDADGAVYAVGELSGEGASGSFDSVLAKYDAQGSRTWSALLESSQADQARDVVVDGAGHVYVAGKTNGNLGGESNAGGGDAFVATYDGAGQRTGVDLVGTSTYESGAGVAVGKAGTVYLAGATEGDLDGQTNDGGADGFVMASPGR